MLTPQADERRRTLRHAGSPRLRRRSGRRRRLPLAGVLVAAVALVLPGAAAAAGRPAPPRHGAAQTGTEKILLAVGDSLAAGYQPTDGRSLPPVDPATGYADAGYPGGYAADLAAARHLRLLDLGCPGETTASYTGTPAQASCGDVYRGELGASDQQAAVLAALAGHRGEVALVTFDLGANDLDACVLNGSYNARCLVEKTAAVLARLPRFLATLQTALARDDPGARLVAMDYYDPFLGLADDPGGARGTTLATLSLGALESFDASLRAIYGHAKASTAAVSSAFQTASLLPPTVYGGKRLPRDVAVVCELTYMCPLPGAATSEDIHPDSKGYARIAAAFEAALAGR